MPPCPSSSKQQHHLSPSGGGSSAAAAGEKEQQSNAATTLTKSILDFPSRLFHECFRKSFVLELDRLCGLAWEISRMEDEEEETCSNQKHRLQDKTDVLLETKIEALHLRWNKFADLYSEHTKCEDATMFPELNLRVANVTKVYELEHEAEEWLFEEVGGLVNTVWKETKEMMDRKKADRSGEGGRGRQRFRDERVGETGVGESRERFTRDKDDVESTFSEGNRASITSVKKTLL